MDELKNLLTCGVPWIEQRASIALDLQDQHARGDITDDEYNELLQDLIRTDDLNAECDDINLKSAVITAVSAVMKVA